MNKVRMIIANPQVVLREEFDDWAILFDPDTGEGFAVDPVGVFIWKRLDGRHTAEEIVAELRKDCKNVPDDALTHYDEFIAELIKRGLVGKEIKKEK